MRARIAANSRWANASEEERRAAGALARKGFDDRFDREVDPEGVLEPAERARRAEHARKAYFLSLAFKSARSRRGASGERKERAQRDLLDQLAVRSESAPPCTSRPSCVYRFFDPGHRLLYVGKTVRGVHRFWEHAECALWWPEVAYSTVEHFASDEQAIAAEEYAIRTEHPVHNFQHGGAW